MAMTRRAVIITDAGSPVPDDLMPKWCEMWADGDRRLRADEIALNVLGRQPARPAGQLWQRVAESAFL
jgi:hypothetical protein